LLILVAAVALAIGHALPRQPQRSADMLDAVAAVQRHSPLFLISEPYPPGNWVKGGALYLCRSPKTAEELDVLSKHPWGKVRWDGVVCFKGTANPNMRYVPWVSEGCGCLPYGQFAVFGDPDLLEEVRGILIEAGYRPARP
jgi:hypothetical protein